MRPNKTRKPFTPYQKDTQTGPVWYARFWDKNAHRYAVTREELDRDPFRNVGEAEETPKERGILTPAEAARLIRTPVSDPRHRLAVLLGLLCGMRMGEVRGLFVKRSNMPDAELARKMGISPQALSRKMNKEKFTDTDMVKIAEILNCSWNMESREWFKMNDTGEEI